MTHPRTTPQAAKPGLPRLRPVVSCAVRAAAFLLCFALSALMAFAPFDAKLDGGLRIESSKAHAVAPYVAGASDFLSAAAAGAGLTESEFVATVVGMSSTAIGVNLGVNAGVNYGESLGHNLDSLMDAADYPDWDYLDNSDKEAWGSREYYETAKFNSLCDAFGLGDARQRFHSSGGGGSNFTASEVTLLSNIGQIGSTWINRGNVLFEDIRNLLDDDGTQVLRDYIGSYYGEFDASGIDDWPLPYTNVKLGYGTIFKYEDGSWNSYFATSTDVYLMSEQNGSTQTGLEVYAVSKSAFNYATNNGRGSTIPQNLNGSSTFQQNEYNGETIACYVASVGWGGRYPNVNNYTNIPVNLYSDGDFTSQDVFKALNIIVNNKGIIESNFDEIADYPGEEEIPDNQPIYYPEQGITNNTVWNNYITQPSNPDPDPENPPVVERPDNPFNPDDQSGTEKWKQDTSANIQGLGRVHFEKLFPFSLYYDLQLFWNKVQSVAGIGQGENGLNIQASSQYEIIELTFYVPGVMEDAWTFDLEPVHDLLLITKPFVLVFLIFLEIISMIFFWKGILTGS